MNRDEEMSHSGRHLEISVAKNSVRDRVNVGSPAARLFDGELILCIVVYRLKSVETIKMKFVAPMPEQIATPTIHFLLCFILIFSIKSYFILIKKTLDIFATLLEKWESGALTKTASISNST